MRTALFCLLVLVCLGAPAQAQELNCTITVNFDQVADSQYSFLSDLRDDIDEYVNGRSWTEDRFQDIEQIDCGFNINVTAATGLDQFTASVVVNSRRPIYGTVQRTTMIQLSDNQWGFRYNQGQPLIYNPNQFNSLTSVLDYYVYLLLGYDYDSFAVLGGTPYFEEARRIADLAQAQQAVGWGSLPTDRSRTTLIRQILDPRYSPLRQANYRYHFGALDRFVTNTKEAWEGALETMQILYDLYGQYGRQQVTDVFFTSKFDEIPRLFADAPQRGEAYAFLIEMDIAHQSSYDALAN